MHAVQQWFENSGTWHLTTVSKIGFTELRKQAYLAHWAGRGAQTLPWGRGSPCSRQSVARQVQPHGSSSRQFCLLLYTLSNFLKNSSLQRTTKLYKKYKKTTTYLFKIGRENNLILLSCFINIIGNNQNVAIYLQWRKVGNILWVLHVLIYLRHHWAKCRNIQRFIFHLGCNLKPIGCFFLLQVVAQGWRLFPYYSHAI